MPWHDLHLKLSGPIVSQLLDHIREHLQMSLESSIHARKFAELTATLTAQADSLRESTTPAAQEDNIWKAQVLRSYPNVRGFQPNFFEQHDQSFQQAILNGITQAERFIYMESQYIIGRSHTAGTEHEGNKIPEFLVDKIIQKHKQGEAFHVYIVLPMCPDAGPSDLSANTVRYYQHRTMQWMLDEINRQTGGNAHQHLTFLWLGKTHGKTPAYDALAADPHTTREQLLTESRRNQIYVHSKFFMADFRFVIMGSANINNRSMSGTVDTEIGTLLYPSKKNKELCYTQLKTYMQDKLWAPYFGDECVAELKAIDAFDWLERPQAAEIIRRRSQQNIVRYYQNTTPTNPTTGYIMCFPFALSAQERRSLAADPSVFDTLPDTPDSLKGNTNYNFFLPANFNNLTLATVPYVREFAS